VWKESEKGERKKEGGRRERERYKLREL